MLLVMNPETFVGSFGLKCILWTIRDSRLGITDGFISFLHVLLALSGL